MTDSDLRELDGWIAEKFMGWEPLDSESPSWDNGTHIITYETTSFSDAFQPTRLPSAFALVKCEIERRGWDWEVSKRSIGFMFNVLISDTEKILRVTTNKFGETESEELAGCLAVKAAVEGSK